MINLILLAVMVVVIFDSVAEWVFTRKTVLEHEFRASLTWRFIAVLLIVLAISK